MKKLSIKIDGKEYIVEVELLEDDSETTSLPVNLHSSLSRSENLSNLSLSGDNPPVYKSSKTGKSTNCLESPVTGTVLEVVAKPGQRVTSSDLAVVVEAMKMKTNIYHQINGVVKSVNLGVGDVIDTGTILVYYE